MAKQSCAQVVRAKVVKEMKQRGEILSCTEVHRYATRRNDCGIRFGYYLTVGGYERGIWGFPDFSVLVYYDKPLDEHEQQSSVPHRYLSSRITAYSH